MARNESPVMGPAAAEPPVLSSARRRVLRALQDAGEPLTLAMLSEVTGTHANTLREHLSALQAAGLVTAEAVPVEAGRRGRPARRYRPTGQGVDVGALSLVVALATELGVLDEAPDLALRAGARWGASLGPSLEAAGPGDVIDRLTRLGFAPREVEEGIVLRACPVGQAAVAAPGVVCRMHLGAVRQLLPEVTVIDLVTDGHPEGCLLRVAKPF